MTKEDIYDAQISPLMTQVIDICRSYKIALLINFRLADDLQCTTALLAAEYEPSEQQIDALAILKPQPAFALAETTVTQPDGSKRITIQRIS